MIANGPPGGDDQFVSMWSAIAHNRFTPNTDDADAAKAAYERHNADVRAQSDPARLVEWQPGDGWEPLCTALHVDVPDEPFPHVNTAAEFQASTSSESTPGTT